MDQLDPREGLVAVLDEGDVEEHRVEPLDGTTAVHQLQHALGQLGHEHLLVGPATLLQVVVARVLAPGTPTSHLLAPHPPATASSRRGPATVGATRVEEGPVQRFKVAPVDTELDEELEEGAEALLFPFAPLVEPVGGGVFVLTVVGAGVGATAGVAVTSAARTLLLQPTRSEHVEQVAQASSIYEPE